VSGDYDKLQGGDLSNEPPDQQLRPSMYSPGEVGPDDHLTIEDFERVGPNVIVDENSPTSRRRKEILGAAPLGEQMMAELDGGSPEGAREVLDEDKLIHPEDPLIERNRRLEER